MNYNFNQDIIDGESAEKRVAEIFCDLSPLIEKVQFNKDNRYDIKLILKNKSFLTVQVKRDFLIDDTDNFAFQTFCRGKSSGIAVTLSDIFVVYTKNSMEHAYAFSTDFLKRMVFSNQFRTVSGGDKDSLGNSVTKMVLIPKRIILNKSVDLCQKKTIDLSLVAHD